MRARIFVSFTFSSFEGWCTTIVSSCSFGWRRSKSNSTRNHGLRRHTDKGREKITRMLLLQVTHVGIVCSRYQPSCEDFLVVATELERSQKHRRRRTTTRLPPRRNDSLSLVSSLRFLRRTNRSKYGR